MGLGRAPFHGRRIVWRGADKNEFRVLLRTALEILDASLDGDILFFNARPLLLEMVAPANPYGFTHTSAASPCYTGDLTGSGGSVCADPESYVFWDPNGHLTARANQILGNAMVEAIPEPATLGLLGLGLLGLRLAGRERLAMATS